MAFKTRSIPQQNGGWFKPKAENGRDHSQDVAILVEIKDLTRQRPTDHGPKDSVLCDMTFFYDADSLAKGEPDEIILGTRIEQTVLARDLFALEVGDATISTVTQVPSKKGLNPSWVWRSVDSKTEKAVIAYGTAREEAAEKALAEVPGFGDDD